MLRCHSYYRYSPTCAFKIALMSGLISRARTWYHKVPFRCTMHTWTDWTALQGEEIPQISRFQAQAIGSKIYIHTHRSLQDILVLDVSDADAPSLSLQPVSSRPEPPMSRQACLEASALTMCKEAQVHFGWKRMSQETVNLVAT